jgi:hypothetical protein
MQVRRCIYETKIIGQMAIKSLRERRILRHAAELFGVPHSWLKKRSSRFTVDVSTEIWTAANFPDISQRSQIKYK